MVKISVLTPTIRPEGLKIVQECLSKQTIQDFEWLVEIGIPEKGCDLNAAYNRMIKRATGELMVSYQDFITIQDDGLEQFWKAYQEDKKTFYTAPVGQTLDYKDIQWDWRESPHAISLWRSWEIDFGACPMQALWEIGGFDELLDEQWAGDNVNVGLRAEMAGYKFKNLPNNKAIALSHNKIMEHPFQKNFSPNKQSERLDRIRMGEKIDYLNK